jgi:hypothetical protein
MPALPEKFWQWVTSGLMAILLALMTINWQYARHEREALAQMYDWTNKAQDGRLDRLETRQEDVRTRLSKIESQYVFEALAALSDLRKRLQWLEERAYKTGMTTVPPARE